jgi:hypothetical protein
VIERFVCGKLNDPAACEDVIVSTPHFAGVLDGVSDRTGRSYNGRSGGRWAAELVADVIRGLPADIHPKDAVRAMTEALAAGETALHGPSRAGATAAVCMTMYSRARREVWRVGDSTVRLDDVVHQTRMMIDDVLADARAAFIAAQRLAGATDEQIAASGTDRSVVTPIMELQHHFANLDSDDPLAYGVLNGTPVPDRHLHVFSTDGVREVVLASDGYPAVFGTLRQTERYLAEDLAADPLRVGRHRCLRAVHPPLVSFDDRAYLRLAA